jgi:hypothetical protein
MGKNNKWEWVAPMFLVVGIFAIFLSLTYLPLSDWGLSFDTNGLWFYMPWIVVLGVGLYALKQLWRQN